MKRKVSVIKCKSYENKEVRKALVQSLKNLNFKFKKDIKVLIKPNILSPQPPEKAVTTHPVIIEELCKILKKHRAKIYIGESSGHSTNKGFKVSGIGQLKKYGKTINFETSEKQIFNFESVKQVPLPKILFNVDLVINVAKLKTHTFTGATLCIKNLYGCIPGKLKSLYHKVLRTPKNFSKFLTEIHEKIKPQLNVIDGILGLEGLGPGASGKPIKSKIILTGKYAPAVDLIASEIIGFEPSAIYTNKLSNIQKEEIEVVGQKNMKLNFKKPQPSLVFTVPIFHVLNNMFPKSKIKFSHEKCSKCNLCEKNCPVKAIKLAPFPEYNHNKCILCACCIEICPNSAINLEEHWSKKFVRKVYRKFLKL